MLSSQHYSHTVDGNLSVIECGTSAELTRYRLALLLEK